MDVAESFSEAQFDLISLVEATAKAIEGGAGEQVVKQLIEELSTKFAECSKVLEAASSTKFDATVQEKQEELAKEMEILQSKQELLKDVLCILPSDLLSH